MEKGGRGGTLLIGALVAVLCASVLLAGALLASHGQLQSAQQRVRLLEKEQAENRERPTGQPDRATPSVATRADEHHKKGVKGEAPIPGDKPLEEGDARRIPLENIEGIEKLSGLSPESVDQSWLDVGYYLSYWDYDLDEVRIRIFDEIHVSDTHRRERGSGAIIYEYTYFFQIIGEHTYCYVSFLDTRVHPPFVYVGELGGHVEGINDYFY